MCGIVGLCSFTKDLPLNSIEKMLEKIKHRGPDDLGIYRGSNINLGMRRLEILDKSGGKQPFEIGNRYEVTFNGEIYNHLKLRELIPSYDWKTRSDTETIGVLFQYLGIKSFSFLNGMFAISIWDKVNKQLIFARDRFGEKPFFYKFENEIFMYGSTCDSLDEFNTVNRNLNPDSIKTYLCLGYLPPNECLDSRTYTLSPGSFAILDKNGFFSNSFLDNNNDRDNFNEQDNKTTILQDAETLEAVVSDQLIADVPVGIFLSGGYDSGLLAYIASKKTKNIQSFSALFTNNKLDFNRARDMALKLNFNHNEVKISDDEILGLIKTQALYFDEPFGDSASLAMLALSSSAKSRVGVALSGDGADELFGGYNWRYLPFALTSNMRSFTKYLPSASLRAISFLGRKANKQNWNEILQAVVNARRFENSSNPVMEYLNFNYPFLSSLVPNFSSNPTFDFNSLNLKNAMNFDKRIYLPGDILVKTDRASMANSLEVRSPYLDPRIVHISEKLNPNQLITKYDSKIYLKSMGQSLGFKYDNGFPKTGLGGKIKELFASDGVENDFKQLLKLNLSNEICDLIGKEIFGEFSKIGTQNSWNLYMLLNWADARRIESINN